MGDAANPVLPDFNTQGDAVLKANYDAAAAVSDRLAWPFAPHEQATPDMTIRLEAGHLFTGVALTEIAAQDTGTITAPSANPRIDRVVIDEATGAVSVITGAENASPTAPAITAGNRPVCQILLDNSPATTAITNSLITDERAFGEVNPDVISQADAEAGTATDERIWTAQRVAQAIAALASATDNVARDNIMLNAFRIAINGGLSFLNMQDGMVDEFEDETGVDTGASTNENYDASDDFYSNGSIVAVAQGAGTAIGDMTTGAGLSAAFDGTTSQTRLNSTRLANASTAWVGKDWGASTTRIITQVVWYGPSDTGINQSDTSIRIRIQESATGAWSGEETTIGDTGTFDGSASSLVKTIACSGGTAKRYHRAYMDEGSAQDISCAELEFTENTLADMTLVSNAFTAAAEPSEARIVVFEQDVDSVTLNTDLKAYASRDGDTTWTQITLADEGDYETGKQILAGSADISGQPSGTSMKWKLTTHNTKELKVHGVALQWS